MPLDRRRKLGAEVRVAGDGQVATEGVHEPERAVGGVVLERPGVRGVGEHPFRYGRGGSAETPARPSDQRFVARNRPS